MSKPQLLETQWSGAKEPRVAWRCALVSISTVLLLSGVSGQETDLVDTSDLAGRGVVFVTEETSRFGVDHVSSVGDVNGDGVSDLGLIHISEDPVFDLKLYVIFGGGHWTSRHVIAPGLSDSIHYSLVDVQTTKVGASYIINIGDLNGDIYSEFAFTFDNYRPLGSNGEINGIMFIIHGRPTFTDSGDVVESIGSGIPGTTIFSTRPGTSGTGFEGTCAVLDINGDQRKDLAIGGLLGDGAGPSAGLIYILLETSELEVEVDLADVGGEVRGFTLETPGVPRTVTDAGDFNGDGFEDLIVADGRWESVQNGSVYVFLGRSDPSGHYDLHALSESEDRVLRFDPPPELEAGQLRFARDHQTAGVGDVNGDGFNDIVMGEVYASWNTAGIVADGRVHLVYGGPSSPFRRTVIHSLGGTSLRDRFGQTVSSAGDLNGDSIPDLLVGAPRRSERWDQAGEAYVIYGRRDFPEEIRLAEGLDGIRIPGNTALGGLGWFVGPAGDFNADGNPDFVVGEPHLVDSGEGGSKAFVIFGSGNGRPPLTVVGVEPSCGFVRGGTRVSIRGSGFEGANRVRFGNSDARVIDATATEIDVETPPGVALGPVPVTVSAGETTRTAPQPFEYVPDRPEIDLENPGRWGLRIDGVSGLVTGIGLDFADIDGDGFDDLLVGSDLIHDWVVTVVRGGRELPETMEAFTPGPQKVLMWKRTQTERTFFDVTVRNVGDVNRDGITDVAVAALGESSYLFFGRRDLPGELDFEEEVEAGRAIRFLYDAMASFADFAPLGDLTGDGIGDLAIGLSNDIVLFVAGREEWPPDLDLYDESDPASIFSRLWDGPTLSALLAPVGDVTGDDEPDLLVSGARGMNAPVYLIHDLASLVDLPLGANIREYVQGGGGVVFQVEGQTTGSGNPTQVTGVGDVNGDGIADFAMGDQELTVDTSHDGITFLVHGREDFPTEVTLPFDMSPLDLEGIVRVTGGHVRQSGRALGPTGDYNGDGFPDFVLAGGDLQALPPAHAFLIFGSPELPEVVELEDLRRHGFEMQGIHPHTHLNDSTRSPGDLNGDGAPDFAFSEFSTPYFPPVDGEWRGSVHVLFGLPPRVPFVRGDANGDGSIDITDAIFTLGFLFLGGGAPPCEDAADADDRGTLEITDAVYLLNFLFSGGPEPPPPHAVEGEDPTEDALGCRGF